MKKLSFLLIASFSFLTIADEGRFGRETNDYQYTSLGFSYISSKRGGHTAANMSRYVILHS